MSKKISYIVAAVLALLLGYYIYAYVQHNADRNQTAMRKGLETTQALRDDVEAILQKVMTSGREVAAIMERETLDETAIDSLLKARSLAIDEILGVTVAYEPYAYKKSVALFAPYYDKNVDTIYRLETSYDYTDERLETTTWYVNIRDGGEQWVQPYYGQVVQTLITDYGIPFYYPDGRFKGMVSMTISLKGFTELIHSLSLGKTGYGFVTSSQGEILAHPITEYIGKKNIKDLIATETSKDLSNAYAQMLKETPGNVAYIDAQKKQQTLFFYDKVPASSWNIGVLFFTEDLLGYDTITKRKTINIAIVGSLFLFCLLGIFFNRDYLSVREIWILSIVGSCILLANIFLIGYVEHTNKNNDDVSESPPVTDNTTLSSIINAENLKADTLGMPRYITVPTGMYIDELSFEDSYNVNVSGVVWQKYPIALLDSITIGFRFPQASPFAEAVFIEERYRQIQDSEVLIGYDFRVTAKLNFVYSKFPFDKRNLNLEIQPLNPNDRLLLVPDLGSYVVTNPSQKSGLSPNISLSGNKLLESYFSYHYFDYDNTFGYTNSTFKNIPELHYNINLKRVLINAFVTYLIPIFVTLIMMFIMIYASNKHKERQSDGGIVQGMTAFFFVLVFSHIDLRKNIETAELIYMEYFYFVNYIMIILSTYNLIMYTRPEPSFFDYKDNLIVKSIFWPTFLLLVLMISLAMFY